MKIIECKHKDQAESGGLGRALESINTSLGRQFQNAEEFLVQALQKRLDYRFVCLRNYFPSGATQSPTLILIAPQGIILFQVSTLKGIFRAAGDSWEELDRRSKKFNPVKANIILETLQLSKVLGMRLARIAVELPEIEPVIYFANPGAHVESENPAARILLVDALDRFLSNIFQMPVVIEPEVLDRIVEALQENCSPQTSKASKPAERDIFSLRELEENRSSRTTSNSKSFLKESEALKKFQFSRRQWIFLSIMFIITVVVLVALVMVVLILT